MDWVKFQLKNVFKLLICSIDPRFSSVQCCNLTSQSNNGRPCAWNAKKGADTPLIWASFYLRQFTSRCRPFTPMLVLRIRNPTRRVVESRQRYIIRYCSSDTIGSLSLPVPYSCLSLSVPYSCRFPIPASTLCPFTLPKSKHWCRSEYILIRYKLI